jgi:hypothetical protein
VPGSSFEYAAPLTEAVMLGNVALRAPGRRLSWDAANLRLPDAPELERHLRAEPRVF